ncbi:MAG: DUF2652 domain-containing protein [Cyclobacteriaceae bacterium]
MEKALLFMPDISGFSDFVKDADLTHSKHIISELLEILLQSNELDLTLAEVEGDALFFYKTGNKLPDFDALLRQAKKMFIGFHNHLLDYKYKRICNCGSCSNAENLSLKFIAYYGEIEFIKVGKTSKPFGESVIKVHRLLKNSLPINEYLLVANNGNTDAVEGALSRVDVFDTGEIPYSYVPLDKLKSEIKPENFFTIDFSKEAKKWKHSFHLKAHAKEVYRLFANIDNKKLWNTKLIDIKHDKVTLDCLRAKHRCVFKGGAVNIDSVEKRIDNTYIITEEVTDIKLVEKMVISYNIKSLDDKNLTLFSIEGYPVFKHKWQGFFLRPFMKKMFWDTMMASLEAMKVFVEENAEKVESLDNNLTLIKQLA